MLACFAVWAAALIAYWLRRRSLQFLRSCSSSLVSQLNGSGLAVRAFIAYWPWRLSLLCSVILQFFNSSGLGVRAFIAYRPLFIMVSFYCVLWPVLLACSAVWTARASASLRPLHIDLGVVPCNFCSLNGSGLGIRAFITYRPWRRSLHFCGPVLLA